jgi:hypothetical protein
MRPLNFDTINDRCWSDGFSATGTVGIQYEFSTNAATELSYSSGDPGTLLDIAIPIGMRKR